MLGPDAYLHLGALDALAAGDSPVHRLDPRAKVLTTALFIVTVASYGRYEVAAMAPLALFPAVLMAMGDIRAGYLGRRMLAALPFVLLVGILNPVLDRAPALQVGPVTLSWGWISFASILLRFALTVGSALILVATTSFDGVCLGMEKLGAPRVFTQQLGFLYRYAFLLVAETTRLARARTLRAFGRSVAPAEFASLSGQLLVRTWDRARRVHVAMLARGFNGAFPARAGLAWDRRDLLFTVAWALVFAGLRAWNVPALLTGLATGGRG